MNYYIDDIPREASYPCFRLVSSTWDDFSCKTTFKLQFYDLNQQLLYIGSVKIGHIEEETTINVIPKVFSSLDENYFSLGQEISYYERLNFHLKDQFDDILENLNDIAFFGAIRDKIEHTRSFRVSLIRSSEAEGVLNNAKNVIYNIPFENQYMFSYSKLIQGASEPHRVNFNFDLYKDMPNRIIALIGKNGTGKTQLLAHIANDLSDINKIELDKSTFSPHRPLFTKIIAISFSYFDNFSRPEKGRSISYRYCGIRNSNGEIIKSEEILNNYKESIAKIVESNIQRHWYNYLNIILGEELTNYYYDEIFTNQNIEVVIQKSNRLLSSGQSFLMYIFTEIIANIRYGSLLLFDEPELHLHPNAVANIIRIIEEILKKNKSFAIIATHSPQIIQEIPSRFVKVIEREGSIPIVRELYLECFGENLDTITNDIFLTKDVDGNYKDVLKGLASKMTFEEVNSLFENRLSLNAKTWLLEQYE